MAIITIKLQKLAEMRLQIQVWQVKLSYLSLSQNGARVLRVAGLECAVKMSTGVSSASLPLYFF